jgi:hypothetical protein
MHWRLGHLPSVEFIHWKTFFLDRFHKRLHRTQNTVGFVHEVVSELGYLALRHTQHVVQHQNLTRSVYASAYANGGATGQGLGDFG